MALSHRVGPSPAAQQTTVYNTAGPGCKTPMCFLGDGTKMMFRRHQTDAVRHKNLGRIK